MSVLQPVLTHPMTTLVRREFWEHRALWITPLVIAGLLLLSAIAGGVFGHSDIHFDVGDVADQRRSILSIVILSLTAPQYVVMAIMLFFYLIDCLYTERKDRSILFWKSMPVSDRATVISKLVVALVIVPLGIFLVTLLTNFIVAVIMGASSQASLRDMGTWLALHAAMLPSLAVLMLWYAPIAGYLLLVSAWSRRNVFLWAVVPPLLLMMIENRALQTSYLATLLEYRSTGVWRHFAGESFFSTEFLTQVFQGAGALRVLLDVDLWIGLVIAAAFVYGAIRIRRYRDDT